MIKPQKTLAKLILKNFINNEIIEFVFKMKEKIDWLPGQFSMMSIKDDKGNNIKRAYSIASSPSLSPTINFIIKKVENGKFTKLCFDNLEVGQNVELTLPYGDMTLNNENEELLIIATGIGISPMVGIINFLEEKQFPKMTRFIFGCRYEKDLCFFNKFNEWAKKYKNFEYYPSVSRTEKNDKLSDEYSSVSIGRANKTLDNMNIDFPLQKTYICGSPEVVSSIKKQIVELGVKEENIKTEAF